MRKFMITLNLPGYFTEDFVRLIPPQRKLIGELLTKGKVSSFSLNTDRTQAWIVVNASSIARAERLIESFPMYDYFDYEILELAVYDTEFLGLPEVMLN